MLRRLFYFFVPLPGVYPGAIPVEQKSHFRGVEQIKKEEGQIKRDVEHMKKKVIKRT